MTRAEVLARLKSLETPLRANGVEALYLYGSYARDEADADSDIDILADFAEGRDADFFDFLAPYEQLEEAFPEISVGFSTRDGLVPLYRPSIETSAVRVF